MKTAITFNVDTDSLAGYTDEYLATLWYIAQANPAPIEDGDAGEVVEAIGREIIKRFLGNTAPPLWNHQGRHHYWCALTEHCKLVDGKWTPRSKDDLVAADDSATSGGAA